MRDNPLILADKIAALIVRERGASYTEIRQRAQAKGIDPLVLEQALERLHKNPMIHRTMAGGDVQYSVKVAKTPVGAPTHVQWVSANYPWPDKGSEPAFVMPFPEIDMSWMFLKTLKERDSYKAAVRGVAYVKPKRYEHARR